MKLRAEFDAMVFRQDDTRLTDDQMEVESVFASFLERRATLARVRECEGLEPPGFDQALWDELASMGAVSMGVATDRGGDGAGMVELVLVADHVGRRLAPVPFVDAATSARLLARLDTAPGGEVLAEVLACTSLATLALHPFDRTPNQLVPSGAIAHVVVALVNGELAVARPSGHRETPPNLGDLPTAWLTASNETWTPVAAASNSASMLARATLEWRLLTASMLIGAGDAVLELAVDYGKQRVAFDIPIGAFQAISHPLVDVATDLSAGRRLVRRAAWFVDHEPDEAPRLIHAAYAHAARSATRAMQVSIHTHGGIGVSMESDLQLYFRRSKAWPLQLRDPNDSVDALGKLLAERVATAGGGR